MCPILAGCPTSRGFRDVGCRVPHSFAFFANGWDSTEVSRTGCSFNPRTALPPNRLCHPERPGPPASRFCWLGWGSEGSAVRHKIQVPRFDRDILSSEAGAPRPSWFRPRLRGLRPSAALLHVRLTFASIKTHRIRVSIRNKGVNKRDRAFDAGIARGVPFLHYDERDKI